MISGSVWEYLFLPSSKTEQSGCLLKEMGLEKSLDSEVAAEGSSLSPGEQKILLARTLLRDAPFRILDEPMKSSCVRFANPLPS